VALEGTVLLALVAAGLHVADEPLDVDAVDSGTVVLQSANLLTLVVTQAAGTPVDINLVHVGVVLP